MSDTLDFTSKDTILVVDDTPDNLTLMNGILKSDFKVKLANNGERALKIANTLPLPDLILLDIAMPDIDGYEVCRRLKADAKTALIPVIFLTAKTEIEDEQKGFDVGCVDYITKPVSPPIVMARVKTHLLLKSARDFLTDQNQYLEREVARRTREVEQAQDVTIMALASLAETRDNETGQHLKRTQHYVKALATKLREQSRFAAQLDDKAIDSLYKSAPLHDIGKVGIPDHILLKPGKLTQEEFEVMKRHTTLGRDAIASAEAFMEPPNSFFHFAKEIAYSHHEKWNGSGYPEGLLGETIPLSARLMAIADVYDAVISKRVYKTAKSHEEAVEVIRAGSGTHFDPSVAAAFLDIADEFKEIAERYADDA